MDIARWISFSDKSVKPSQNAMRENLMWEKKIDKSKSVRPKKRWKDVKKVLAERIFTNAHKNFQT